MPSTKTKKLSWGPGSTVGWKENTGPLHPVSPSPQPHPQLPSRGMKSGSLTAVKQVTRIQGPEGKLALERRAGHSGRLRLECSRN